MVKNGPKKSAPECPVECGGGVQSLFGQCPNVGGVNPKGCSLRYCIDKNLAYRTPILIVLKLQKGILLVFIVDFLWLLSYIPHPSCSPTWARNQMICSLLGKQHVILWSALDAAPDHVQLINAWIINRSQSLKCFFYSLDLFINCSTHINIMEMEKLLRGEIFFFLNSRISATTISPDDPAPSRLPAAA